MDKPPVYVRGTKNIVAHQVHLHAFPPRGPGGTTSKARAWCVTILGVLVGYAAASYSEHPLISVTSTVALIATITLLISGGSSSGRQQSREPAPDGHLSNGDEPVGSSGGAKPNGTEGRRDGQ